MTNSPRSVRSQCPYCGVGCGLELLPPAVKGEAVKRDAEGNPMWTARGDREHPSSLGQVCILSLIHISEPTRQEAISYAVFCLKKKNV